ncbi:bile acid:sodium symporter [Thauera sp. JM12B12]|uniref:bile acid:sodium symporter n=1 Tax=Thauera sp. JM12B12 TaxID=3142262 RepID=UPI0031F377ED
MNLLTLLFDRFTILLTAVLPAQGAFAALFDGLTHAGIALLFFLHGARLSRRAIIDGVDAEPAAQAHPGAGAGGRRRLRAEPQ